MSGIAGNRLEGGSPAPLDVYQAAEQWALHAGTEPHQAIAVSAAPLFVQLPRLG
ncbi:hypothetical protein QWM81_04980 [Streptomyces ficellus]|uniref:Uncharacterized protein n=1 Tax=Streptomyces ficellus TaxID=1977088 RepID=A0ABT7Z1M9_9ACTN|nr:hypothetical protein [Streptomyces ficellus]MDN3293402.1 hypothetical protein [Streptomyces ficellus]